MAIELHLPWPPSVNHYWARNRNGSVRISDRGEAYRWAVQVACGRQGASRGKFKGRLGVSIEAYPPDRRIRDLDNTLKASLDALKHAGIYEDDSQIDDLHVMRRKVMPREGALVVSVRDLVSEERST